MFIPLILSNDIIEKTEEEINWRGGMIILSMKIIWMKAKEYMQKLQLLPPDTRIVIPGYEEGYNDILRLILLGDRDKLLIIK